MKWPKQHLAFSLGCDVDWSSKRLTITPELKKQFPGLCFVSPRELDILAVTGVAISENKLRLVDTSMTIGRGQRPSRRGTLQKTVGCLTPGKRLWITTQNRFMVGAEALRFQGINYDIVGKDNDLELLKYSSTLLRDLAGNAFHMGCAIAILLAMYCSVGRAIVARDDLSVPIAVLRALGEAPMTVDDAEDALDSIWAEEPSL